MMRILLLALMLTACGCTTAPIVPDAQAQLDKIISDYRAAHKVETDHCWADKWQQPCEGVRRSGYEFEAVWVSAWTERTGEAIDLARLRGAEYADSLRELH